MLKKYLNAEKRQKQLSQIKRVQERERERERERSAIWKAGTSSLNLSWP